MTFISKSKYIAGLQCSKLLWYYYNAREQIPPYDEATQAIFDQGHQVGELAQSLFPGGVEIGGSHTEFEEALRRTSEALSLRKPLFEPAFRFGNAYARADILSPAGKDRWDIFEVKSATEVKDVYIHDMALQKYTYAGAGLDIRKCFLMYIDNAYERLGEVEPERLFARADVTGRVDALLPNVGDNLRKMLDVIRREKVPDISIGPWCSDPYDCPLISICWNFLPETSIFDLSRIGKRGFELLERGITRVADIPDGFRLNATQALQVKAFMTGRPRVDRPAIKDFLGSLAYPLFFLDFETFATAIPLFDHVRPYQQVPFQFSLHAVRKAGGESEHFGFIADGNCDPRPGLLARLFPLLGTTGSLVSYNASFEKGILRESCRAFPDFARQWESAEPRFVDLLAPFRSFHYYHPDQCGSASIKSVLPALTGKGYDQLEIQEGSTASLEFLRVTFGDVPESERQRVRRQLEQYCALDTLAMVWLLAELENVSRGHTGKTHERSGKVVTSTGDARGMNAPHSGKCLR